MRKLKPFILRCLLFSLIVIFVIGCNQRISGNLPNDKLNLADLLINEDDLPDLSWFSTGVTHIGPEESGTSDITGIAYFPIGHNDFFGSNQFIFRYSSDDLANEYFNELVKKYEKGYLPAEWVFQSTSADRVFLSCEDNRLGFPVCNWMARYGRIIIMYEAWLKSGYSTLRDMQEQLEILMRRQVC